MNRSRVMMFTHMFPPAASSGVMRTMRYIRYLREFGWEPLITTVQAESTRYERDASLLDSVPEDMTIIRTPVWAPDERLKSWFRFSRARETNGNPEPENVTAGPKSAVVRGGWSPKALTRKLWEFAFSTPDDKIWWIGPAVRASLRAVKEHRPNVLYSTGPPHSTHLIAATVKRLTGLPLVCDFRDPWAGAPWRATDRNPWGFRLQHLFERYSVRSADALILNTPRLGEEFKSRYPGHAGKIDVIPNGFDPDHLSRVERLRESRGREVKDRAPGPELSLCHPGALYNQRDPRPLADAIGRLAGEGHRVVFEQIGYHDRRFELADYVERNGLQNRVVLTDRLPHEEVLERMQAADVLVLVQPGTHLQVPGKLYEMLMFRKPILALADDGATADVIRDYRLGLVADPRDTDAIADGLRTLLRDGQTLAEDADWPAALEAFDGRRLTQQLARRLEQVAGREDG